MLTRDDLIDLLLDGLAKAGPAAASAPPGRPAPAAPSGKALVPPLKEGPKGRPFLSEYEIKKRLTAGGNRLTIQRDSILSPLALDWLTLNGVQVVRE